MQRSSFSQSSSLTLTTPPAKADRTPRLHTNGDKCSCLPHSPSASKQASNASQFLYQPSSPEPLLPTCSHPWRPVILTWDGSLVDDLRLCAYSGTNRMGQMHEGEDLSIILGMSGKLHGVRAGHLCSEAVSHQGNTWHLPFI